MLVCGQGVGVEEWEGACRMYLAPGWVMGGMVHTRAGMAQVDSCLQESDVASKWEPDTVGTAGAWAWGPGSAGARPAWDWGSRHCNYILRRGNIQENIQSQANLKRIQINLNEVSESKGVR